MTGGKRAWKGVTGGGAIGQKVLKIFFSALDVRFGYAILALVAPFYMIFARKGYRAIYHYFRNQHRYLVWKSFFMTYRNHFAFGQAILDRFAIYAGRKNFRIENPDNDLFIKLLDSPRGCIIAGSHVGNFELCGYLLKQNRKRINSLVFGGEASEIQKNRMKIFGGNFVRLVPVLEDLSHIFVLNRALADGEIVSMPCDRVFGSNKTVECNFLNGKADFPTGAFALASQFDVPAVALFVMKTSSTSYRIHLAEIFPDISATSATKREQTEAMARSYSQILENIVRKYPEQWFNFYSFWK